MNKYIPLTISSVIVISFLVGCGPRALNSEAENVRIVNSVSNNCKFISVITQNDIHGNMSLFPSEQDMAIDHNNMLKNQAARLGGNTVVFHGPIRRKGQHILRMKGAPEVSHEITIHDVIGKVYLCPK